MNSESEFVTSIIEALLLGLENDFNPTMEKEGIEKSYNLLLKSLNEFDICSFKKKFHDFLRGKLSEDNLWIELQEIVSKFEKKCSEKNKEYIRKKIANLLKKVNNIDKGNERYINNAIDRMFRNSADEDYIIARIAYFNGFNSHFLWNSYQSIEKYLKSILLYNRENISGEKHNVVLLYDRVKRKMKATLKIMGENFDIPQIVEDFIDYLEKKCDGGNIRYSSSSYCLSDFYSSPLINVLDEAVWSIRKYCQVLFYKEEILYPGLPKRYYTGIYSLLKIKQSEYKINGGHLEKILRENVRVNFFEN